MQNRKRITRKLETNKNKLHFLLVRTFSVSYVAAAVALFVVLCGGGIAIISSICWNFGKSKSIIFYVDLSVSSNRSIFSAGQNVLSTLPIHSEVDSREWNDENANLIVNLWIVHQRVIIFFWVILETYYVANTFIKIKMRATSRRIANLQFTRVFLHHKLRKNFPKNWEIVLREVSKFK